IQSPSNQICSTIKKEFRQGGICFGTDDVIVLFECCDCADAGAGAGQFIRSCSRYWEREESRGVYDVWAVHRPARTYYSGDTWSFGGAVSFTASFYAH